MHQPAQQAASQQPSAQPRRHLALPGTLNVRDVGGYPAEGGKTRWGTLLRSDALHQLDDAGRSELADLGLRTVVDLREPREREVAPDALDGLGLRFHLQPLADGRIDITRPWRMPDLYREFVDACGAALGGAIAAIAHPGALPALVHCSAGKDRAGLVIALTLAAVGVPDDVIAADYHLSRRFFRGPDADKVRQQIIASGITPELADEYMDAPPELILGTLAHVRDRYGSVPAYLARHGVDDTLLARLHTALVAPSS